MCYHSARKDTVDSTKPFRTSFQAANLPIRDSIEAHVTWYIWMEY